MLRITRATGSWSQTLGVVCRCPALPLRLAHSIRHYTNQPGFLPPSRKPADESPSKPVKSLSRPRRDEEITARYITFVDADGQVHPNSRLDHVLRQFDRSTYFLVEVDPTAAKPVCRLMDKKALFEKQKASKKKKQTSPESVVKEITFGWNVSEHDMEHKLGRAIQFLEKGNKVKIEIVSKKGQKRVDKDEQDEVIQRVAAFLKGFKSPKGPAFMGHKCIIQYESK